MKRKKRLPVLKPEFPPMRCDDGCGDCCGPVPATAAEFQRVLAYIRERDIKPKDQGITCPLYLDGKCSVYPVRPLICRAFGHVEGMVCSRGHNTNVPREVDTKIVANGRVEHLLHDVLAIVNPGTKLSPLLEQLKSAFL